MTFTNAGRHQFPTLYMINLTTFPFLGLVMVSPWLASLGRDDRWNSGYQEEEG